MAMMKADENDTGAFPPLYATASLESDVYGNIAADDDGRLSINLNSKFSTALQKLLPPSPEDLLPPPPPYSTTPPKKWSIPLNIVIQIVGSRGDVQPLLALGNELQRSGHRVRIATHDVFETFVKSAGLEFYPIGGDPAELMAYMVQNPGLIPSMDSLRKGEIRKKRRMISTILHGCWRSCIEPDLDSKIPFVAEAIIANPPSFAHVHCAQALGVPVHLVFTMPWSRTRAFPHPLANLQGLREGSEELGVANSLSFDVVEWMTWQGLGDVINEWRVSLGLEAVDVAVGATLARSLKTPFTYCWSPALVPKPVDWPAYIDVCGFFFREEPKYTPPADLDAFLKAGERPVYIGFGSIVLKEPEKLTKIVLEAVRKCGVRAIISRGWSKIGSNLTSDNIFYLDECPHEWLFKHVAAVVHHGGAGTTACGLLNGCPTAIVPFFGDQPFWGDMVAAAGAGPSPIPHKELNSDNLTRAIQFCLTPNMSAAARDISARMQKENGVKSAVASFHRNLPLERLGCDLFPDCPAAWEYKSGKRRLRLSKEAAQMLVESGRIKEKDLKMYEINTLDTSNARWDPLTGGTSSLASTAIDMATAVQGIITAPISTYRKSKFQSHTSSSDAPQDSAALAGDMALSSVKNIGRFNLNLFKGTMVDLPVAVAEGMRTAPRLYGEDVQDYGTVTDWRSGFVVAGKTFTHGISGISDLATKPYEGTKNEGALGFAKGFGVGALNAVMKPGSALLGLVAYPAQGISKSIRSLAHMGPRKRIIAARLAEGVDLVGRRRRGEGAVRGLLESFDWEVGRDGRQGL